MFWGLMLFAILVSLAWVLRPSLVPQFAGVIVPSRTFLFQRGRPKSRVEIGKSGSVLQWTGAEGQPMFEFTQNARLTIENIRGRLYVTTLVTDDNGKVIAEISRNHWRVAPPPGTWDLNYNRNTLEVRGVHGRIVLQVEMMADRIRLQGEWWSAPGVGVRLVGIAEGGLIGLFGPNYTVRQCPEIVPFFRYPSASNFGVLA